MAGSYNHCVDEQGRFVGVRHLDNLGDAYEALEEMYGMIWFFAEELASMSATSLEWVEWAQEHYKDGLYCSPGVVNDDD